MAQQEFNDCLRTRCGLSADEARSIISQGYNTARKFRRIDSESMEKLFKSNLRMENMYTAKKQNLRALRAFLLDCDRDAIDLGLFDNDALELHCESLSIGGESGTKTDSDKSQDKIPVWDGDIFRFGAWLKKFYAWIGLKKNAKGVPLTWLLLLKDATVGADGDPIEGAGFEEDPWSVKFRDSAPPNVKAWAENKPMSGPQYQCDTLELYNHLVGRLKGEPLTLSEKYLNDGHRAFRSLLRKYMNPDQCRLMARAAREKLPGLKYHKESGKFGLKDHMAALGECFSALEAAGVAVS